MTEKNVIIFYFFSFFKDEAKQYALYKAQFLEIRFFSCLTPQQLARSFKSLYFAMLQHTGQDGIF